MSYSALHLHTEFSALDGLIPIKKLLPLIKDLGQTACAITDHGNLFGAVDFLREAEKHKITPILGVEQYVCADMADRTQRRNHHLILIAVTDEGWKNLKFLNSMSHLNGFYYVPRIDLALLAQYNTGIIGLSACLGGEIAQAFLGGGYARMREVALRYRAAFRPGCFFLEVQPNAIPEQETLNAALLRLESDIGVPLCATGDCHYLAQSDARAQDMLMAIQTRAKTGDENRLTHGAMNRLYVMHEDEMRAYFAPLGMEHAVDQAGSIGRCVDVTVTLGKPTLPKFPLPPGVDQRAYFRGQCERGLERRLAETTILTHSEAEYQARLEHEMSVIERMDFPGYFLIVAEFVQWAKDQGIPTSPGRGSGAGSLCAYAMRITDIDPLRYGLLFERFLNPERVSMPDFDVDFCERRRDEVIAHIKERYGHKSVGQIATFGRLAGKSAIQAVAGAMGMDWRKAQDLTVGVPSVVEGHPPTVDWIMANGKVLREKMAEDPTVKQIADMALALQGSIKSRGVHASGVVIAPGPLWETVAVCADRTHPEEMVVQASMERTEDLGLIKFDVLGLTTTTVLSLCEKYTGVPMSTISFEDPHTYATIARGDTGGIFQMSGDGITRMLKDMAPTKFEHLSAAIALYRPGPLEGGMVKSYIDRMHGREKVEYLHPALEETTKSTYGLLIFQEDVMSVCRILAGYSLAGADNVRRMMGKKKRELVEHERNKFMAATVAHGACTDPELARSIWDLCEKHSHYSFNKSHSVAYALLSYYTAWYKTNHRAAFYAAIASLAQSDTKKLAPLLHEIRASKITILPPDVNVALSDFTPVDAHTIRAGLLMLKGVGPAMVEKILAGRADGPYKDIWDMGRRGKIPQGAMETLIKAGACDGIIPDRATALASAERATKKKTSQKSLFKDGPEYVKARPMDRKALLAAEKEATGMFLSGHPLDHAHRPDNAVPISGLTECEDGAEIKIRALCTNYEERATKSGAQMATVFFEDETGETEAVCFPRDWAKIATEVQNAFRKDLPLLAQVGVQVEISDTDEGEARSVKLVLRKVVVMEETTVADAPDKAEDEKGPALHVTIPAARANDEDMALLLDRLMSCPGPLGVVLHLGEDRDTLDGLTVGERAVKVLSDLGYAVVKSNS